jgi:hypothetical protein
MPSNNANAQRKKELLKIAEGVRNGTIARKPSKPTEEDLVKMEAMRLEKKEKAKATEFKKKQEKEERKQKLANSEKFFKEAKEAGLLTKKIPKFVKSLQDSKRVKQ